MPAVSPGSLEKTVRAVVDATPVLDVHTHLYDPAFGPLLLWGIDELLTYHYLVAETFRETDLPFEAFWSLPKARQAELVWDHLFVSATPVSEACRGVLTTLRAFGLDPRRKDLAALRQWFARRKPARHVDDCLRLAGLRAVVMTNSPFDDEERPVWERGFDRDPRFLSALRIDPLLLQWGTARKQLAAQGYKVGEKPDARTCAEVRRFLGDWAKRIDALYVMVSLPPDFAFPDAGDTGRLVEEAVLPFCRESGLAFAVMPGVRRAVNPRLRLAGDGIGTADLTAYERLFASAPDVKFLCTVLARENQHQVGVLARKFRNLHPFGCWWFTNIPHLIDEITALRTELLGFTFTPQHSDARVLDQVVYKWSHARVVIADVLVEQYRRLLATGWKLQRAEVERDVARLFGGGFEAFLRKRFPA